MDYNQIYNATALVNSKERRHEGEDFQSVSLVGYNDWDEFIKDMQDHFDSTNIIVLDVENVPNTFVERSYSEISRSMVVTNIDGVFFDILKDIEDWDSEHKDAFCVYCEKVLKDWDLTPYWDEDNNKYHFKVIDDFDDIYCGMHISEEDFCDYKFREYFSIDYDTYEAICDYIDFSKMARDWFEYGNYTWAEQYVFDDHYEDR